MLKCQVLRPEATRKLTQQYKDIAIVAVSALSDNVFPAKLLKRVL